MSALCKIIDNRYVSPCKPLKKATEEGHPLGQRKGVFAFRMMRKGEPTNTYYGAKSGQYKQGVAFNYCPFCGTSIVEPVHHGLEGKSK